jgi:hypothetical protein
VIPKWALEKAVKMFGSKATVSKDRCGFYKSRPDRHPMCSGVGAHPQPCPGKLPVYTIGKVVMGLFNEVKGQGMTWKEAFARAEVSRHYDECRRCLYRSKMKCKALRLLKEKAAALRDAEAARRGIWHSINESTVAC